MLKAGLAASMMCVDFLDTKKDLSQLAAAGIEYLHFDIMDGEFVANYALGPGMIDRIRKGSEIAIDIHLMVERPERKLAYFELRQGDAVSVHAEATPHLQKILQDLKSRGITAGAALNPATPADVLRHVLDVLDYVLIMTVNPGFAGQQLVPATIEKIRTTRAFLDQAGYPEIKIQVDGNVSVANAIKMKQSGADNFVCGTAGLFKPDGDLAAAAKIMRQAIETAV